MNLTQTIKSPLLRHSLAALALATCCVISASAAVTWHDVQFGGFASQGYLKSSANDYLGETSKGSFDFREYAVNASYSIGQFRIGAQAFGQKLGDYGDDKIKLDWATIDYQPAQWFGIRAGRVKMPRGLYNEALDLDSTRPFVLLPQSVYDARLRDFNAAFNGAMIFGNVGLKEFGSLDYKVFYGHIPKSTNSGALDYFNNDAPYENLSMEMDNIRGAWLFWNTPLLGLRTGYSYSSFTNLNSLRSMDFGGGFKPVFGLTSDRYDRHLLSIEYTTGDWVFAAEAGRELATKVVSTGGQPVGLYFDFKSDYYYVSAARRINSWLELGTYFSHSLDTQPGHAQFPFGQPPTLKQNDLALSARFDVTEHVLFKVEGHYMDGAGKIFDTFTHSQPFAQRDTSWLMFAAKITVSF